MCRGCLETLQGSSGPTKQGMASCLQSLCNDTYPRTTRAIVLLIPHGIVMRYCGHLHGVTLSLGSDTELISVTHQCRMDKRHSCLHRRSFGRQLSKPWSPTTLMYAFETRLDVTSSAQRLMGIGLCVICGISVGIGNY